MASRGRAGPLGGAQEVRLMVSYALWLVHYPLDHAVVSEGSPTSWATQKLILYKSTHYEFVFFSILYYILVILTFL